MRLYVCHNIIPFLVRFAGSALAMTDQPNKYITVCIQKTEWATKWDEMSARRANTEKEMVNVKGEYTHKTNPTIYCVSLYLWHIFAHSVWEAVPRHTRIPSFSRSFAMLHRFYNTHTYNVLYVFVAPNISLKTTAHLLARSIHSLSQVWYVTLTADLSSFWV